MNIRCKLLGCKFREIWTEIDQYWGTRIEEPFKSKCMRCGATKMENNRMKNSKMLIMELRAEYLELCKKIAMAKFALDTLPLDEKAKELLKSQIWSMESYATKLVERASHATNVED